MIYASPGQEETNASSCARAQMTLTENLLHNNEPTSPCALSLSLSLPRPRLLLSSHQSPSRVATRFAFLPALCLFSVCLIFPARELFRSAAFLISCFQRNGVVAVFSSRWIFFFFFPSVVGSRTAAIRFVPSRTNQGSFHILRVPIGLSEPNRGFAPFRPLRPFSIKLCPCCLPAFFPPEEKGKLCKKLASHSTASPAAAVLMAQRGKRWSVWRDFSNRSVHHKSLTVRTAVFSQQLLELSPYGATYNESCVCVCVCVWLGIVVLLGDTQFSSSNKQFYAAFEHCKHLTSTHLTSN